MKVRAYQSLLAISFVVCLVLAGAVTYLLLQRLHPGQRPTSSNSDPVIAVGKAKMTAMPSGAMPASADASLAPVPISAQRMQEIGITTATVELKNMSRDLQVPGNVDVDEEKLAYVQTRFPGWIQGVFANATYQYVRKGQPMFTIYSPDLVSSEQEYLLAKQNQSAFSKDAHGMAGKEGDWLLEAAEQRLQQFGVADSEIASLKKNGRVQHDITVYSPVSGYITERNALPNAYVQPETKIYTVADLSTVWVYANVSQEDVGSLRPGDLAQVTVDAYPGRTFAGRIQQILPQVDEATRTVRVRLVFRNPGVTLKPGMYVMVQIHVPLGRQLVVPATAILQSGARAIAFVDAGNGVLEPRQVTVGPQLDDSIIVLTGLKAGDRVVSSANFLVDSEAQLQAAMQNFAPETKPSAPAPNNSAAPVESTTIAFSTAPSTPNKGMNTIRIKLTGSDGHSVSDAQVKVTFFMPAMPAMSMAAENASAVLGSKGNGIYEGTVDLPSGGTWQVTIVAQRNGQIVATKHLSVDAAGGM